ncbi:MAG: PAS domain S-box protein [Verrucomicrobiota bacterium]
MVQPLPTYDEAGRLETLRQYGVLDTPPEPALDDLTAMAAQICATPIALINLVDEKRQWFKSRIGLDYTESPRGESICAFALEHGDLFTVPDTLLDPRFAHFPVVAVHGVRFYASAPLATPEGIALGTLCVLDRVPRTLTPAQEQALRTLARQVITHLELRRQVTALRLSEERFSSAFEHAPIGMALVSLEGRWLKVNQALCDIVGYSREELAEKSFQDLTHPKDLDADLAHVRSLLDGRANTYTMEKRYFHKAGHVVWGNLAVSLARNREHEPLYFISQIKDITESREALVRQRELTRKARAAERAKSEFLATMSHEIRTPLNGVIGMAHILADTELSDMQRECVHTINVSGESLLAVINDILDYSKIEAGRLEMENRTFSLSQCVEEAFDLFATQIRAKKLEATCFVAPEIPALLTGDAMRLRQVLVNLIGNAIKFTARGEISLQVGLTHRDEKGCHLLFAVSDTGIGIPREIIGQLFQPFQQVDTSTTRRYGGTGLGLAICKRLTAFMGGTIWAESRPAAGSTFSFTAVLQPAAGPAAKSSVPDSEGLRGGRRWWSTTMRPAAGCSSCSSRPWGHGGRAGCLGRGGRSASGRAPLRRRAHRSSPAGGRRHCPGAAHPRARADAAHPAFPRRRRAGRAGRRALRAPACQAGEAFLALPGAAQGHRRARRVLAAADERKLDSAFARRHPLAILLAEDNAINQKVGLLLLSRLGYAAEVVGNGRLVLDALERKAYDLILMDIQMPVLNGIEAASLVRGTYGAAAPAIVALTAEALEGDEERFLSLGFDHYLSKPLQAEPLQDLLRLVPRRASLAGVSQRIVAPDRDLSRARKFLRKLNPNPWVVASHGYGIHSILFPRRSGPALRAKA